MISTELAIPGIYLIELTCFEDDRGTFIESFNDRKLKEVIPFTGEFVQDNHSVSKKNVFRGMHFQSPPHAQAKLVRVTAGSVIDYFMDIRKGSVTYGTIESLELSAGDNKLLFLPEGIAHGFLALEEKTEFQYKCSSYYESSSERTLNAHSISGIKLPHESLIMNEKDIKGEDFSSFLSPF